MAPSRASRHPAGTAVSLFERDHAIQKVYAVSRRNRAEVKARLAQPLAAAASGA